MIRRLMLLFFFNEVLSKSLKLFPNRSENLIITGIFENIGIKHCIFVCDDYQEGTIDTVKNFSSRTMMLTVKNHQRLIQYFEMYSYPSVGTVIIANESNLSKFVKMFQKLSLLKIINRTRYFTWLIFLESKLLEKNQINLLIPYNCQFIVVYPADGNEYKILEVFQVKKKTFFSEVKSFEQLRFFYSRRMDLNGTEFIANSYQDGYNRADQIRAERQLEVLNDILEFLNLDVRIKKIPKPNFNQEFDTPGDLLLESFVLHSSMYRSDVLGPMFKVINNWYIKYPSVEQNTDYYTQPFHPKLWICILMIIILGSLVILFISKAEEIKATTIDLAFLGFDSFCNQIGSGDVKKIKFRIVTFTFRITALFIIPAYGATLLSYLAVRIPQGPFTNLKEFTENGEYVLMIRASSFTRYYFERSNDPLIKKIHQDLSLVYTNRTKTMLTKICDEKMALANYDNDIYGRRVPCDILKIKEPISFYFSGYALAKGSPFKDVFNYFLIRFYESGIQKKMQERSEELFLKSFEDPLEPVEIKQMVQVISIIALGIIFSGIMLIFEIIAWNLCRK